MLPQGFSNGADMDDVRTLLEGLNVMDGYMPSSRIIPDKVAPDAGAACEKDKR